MVKQNMKGPNINNAKITLRQGKLASNMKAAFIDPNGAIAQAVISKVLPALQRGVMDYASENIPTTIRMPRFMPKLPKGANIKGVNRQTNAAPVFSGDIGMDPSANSSYGLSKAPVPRKVKLNSGIVPNTYTQDYMFPVQNACDPMHVSCTTLAIPTVTTNPLNSYFLQTIAFDIQTRAQANVAFDIGVATSFSASQLLSSFNAAISALQHYYYFTSILSYESEPANKNSGMIYLRGGISAQQLSLLSQLGRRLEDTPIPPRLVAWVKFMSANYYAGDNQGSAIIKICPNSTLLANSDVINTSVLTTVLNTLSSNANSTIFALMRRAIPQWKIDKLYDVTPIPNYDTNFTTAFSNLAYCVWDGTAATVYPRVPDATTSISYNTFNNKLDGVAYACAGMYNIALADVVPGLCTVTGTTQGITASNPTTRLSYAIAGSVAGFYGSDNSAFNTASRQDSYQLPTGYVTPLTPHLYGTDKCQNVNSNSTLQTAFNSLDFLVNVKGIPNKGTLNSFNRKGNGMV